MEDWIEDYLRLSFVLRTEREPHTLIPEVRAAIQRVDPRLLLFDVQPMEEISATRFASSAPAQFLLPVSHSARRTAASCGSSSAKARG